jgi:hypothetical protein
MTFRVVRLERATKRLRRVYFSDGAVACSAWDAHDNAPFWTTSGKSNRRLTRDHQRAAAFAWSDDDPRLAMTGAVVDVQPPNFLAHLQEVLT